MRDHLDRPLVAVTGIGAVTSLGLGLDDNWRKLLAGESGIRRIARFPTDHLKTTIAGTVDMPGTDPATPSSGRVEKMAAFAMEEAIAAAGIGTATAFPGPLFLGMPPVEVEWPARFDLTRIAGRGDTAALIEAAAGRHDIHEAFLFGGPGERLAARFGTRGAPISLTTACATGASAIQLGVEAIQRGECDACIAVGADGSVHAEALIRFSLLSALSTRNDDPTKAARPFEKSRDGFVMAEGAAALVLEDYDAARARGATIIGLVSGCGERADSFHRTRSNPDGNAIVGAMRNALSDAGLDPSQISYVNGHGTGTPENDKMESFGMRAVFGDAAPPISSNKSMIGHTLSAAGALEAAFSLLTIRDGRLPPTINHDVPDPGITLDVVPNVARDAPVRHVLSNSFGFGGQNVCLVLSAEPA